MAESRLTILINAQGHEQTASALKSLGAELGSLAKVAGAFTLGNLGTQLTGDLAEQFKSVLTETQKFGEQVYKLQGLIGGSAESISGLMGGIEKLSGVEAGAASNALTRFSRGLRGQVDVTETGAESGKTFAGVLSELGVSAVDATGHFRPMTDVLESVMDAEKRLAAEGRAGADAMILFGRGTGLQLAPMLLLGSQAFKEAQQTAQTLGLQLTGQNVESIHTFTLRQREMNEALAGLKLQLGVALMGPLTDLAKHVSDVAVSLNKDNGAGLKQFANDLKDVAKEASDSYKWLKDLTDLLTTIKGSGAKLGNQAPGGGQGLLGGIGERLNEFVKYADKGYNLADAWNASAFTVGQQRASVLAQAGVSAQRPEQFRFERDMIGANNPQAAAGFTRDEKLLALDEQEKAMKRFVEIQTHDINVAQRANLDLVKQEAVAQAGLIPLRQQQSEIALQILQTENQRAAIARQTAVDQARLSGQPSSFALEDSQYRQQLIQAQIRASAIAGKGVDQGLITELIGLKLGEAGLQVGAMEGNRGVTLAQRLADTGQLRSNIATAPAREAQADLQLSTAQQQLAIDSLHAQIEQDRLTASIAVADLERGRRLAEDKLFEVLQRKQELAPTINNFTLEQHINSTGEVDYERIKTDTMAIIQAAVTKSTASYVPPQAPLVPGSPY